MADPALTPEQEAEAQRLFTLLEQTFLDEARQLARLMAGRADAQLLGATEFQVRQAVHGLGAKVLEVTLAERKKKATRAPA
jgi:hypothetical protein